MRLKLPAWGRELRAMRERGEHPPRVWVLAGDDWGARRPATAPSVGVGADWRSERTDWRPLAGLSAHVVDRGGLDLLPLAAEIAVVAAPVVVHWQASGQDDLALEGQLQQWDCMSLLWCARHRAHLWSQAFADDYEARCTAWRMAMMESVLEDAA